MQELLEEFMIVLTCKEEFGYSSRRSIFEEIKTHDKVPYIWERNGFVQEKHEKKVSDFVEKHREKIDYYKAKGGLKEIRRQIETKKAPQFRESITLEIGKTYRIREKDKRLGEEIIITISGETNRMYLGETKNYKTTVLKNNLKQDFYKVKEVKVC